MHVGEIVAAIRHVAAGRPLMSHEELLEMTRLASLHQQEERMTQLTIHRLTPRETEMLQSLANGLSDKKIAEWLGIRSETVRTHMVNILDKLGVQSRLQALIFALRHGIVELS